MPIYKSKVHSTSSPPPPAEPGRLVVSGPRVPVQVEVPTALAKRLADEGKPVPAPATGWGLIDTGATSSAVSAKVVENLGVSPVGVVKVGTAGGRREQATYPIKLVLSTIGLSIEYGQVTGAELEGMDIVVLIGRDFLSRVLFIYDGPSAEYTLAL